jgi:hypothetical protein
MPDGSIDLATSSVDGASSSSTPDLSVAPGPGTDGSSPAACTGPQDCSSAVCCVTSQLGSGSGSASSTCSASCPGNVTGSATSGTISTQACHSDADCTGYSGTANGISSPWTSCCSSQFSTVHFCANAQGAAFGGYTCP